MAKKMTHEDTNGRLEDAIAQMMQAQVSMMQNQTAMMQNQTAFTQTQAALTQNQVALQARMSELERETADRFTRIERDIQAILRVLAEHGRILQALPEAIRDKIGFKPQQ